MIESVSPRKVEAGRPSLFTRLARVNGCQAYLTNLGYLTSGDVNLTWSPSIFTCAG